MRKSFWHVLVLACVVASTSFVVAEEKPKKPVDFEKVFKRLDKDSDGKLTFEEFKGKRDEEKAKKAFARLDKNKDESLSLEEFKTRGKKKKK